MVNISITADQTVIRNNNFPVPWKLNTSEAFGTFYFFLENTFGDLNVDEYAANIVRSVIYHSGLTLKCNEQMVKSKPPKQCTLCGLRETGSAMLMLSPKFANQTKVSLSIQEVEEMRIQNRMKSNYLPVSICDKESMQFERLRSVSQILISLLYYYAFYGFKLVRCRHCNKWFATKSFKEQYCHRISPCCGTLIKGEHTCEQAVRNILQNCTRIRNRIRTKASSTVSAQLGNNSFIMKFESANGALEILARQQPTVENLTKYYKFLKETETSRAWLGG